jgi:hypothetical protein
MFGRNRRPDILSDPIAYKEWEDKMFPWHMHIPSPEDYSCLGEVALERGLDVDDLADSVARFMEETCESIAREAAAGTLVPAPDYRPTNSSRD